MKWTMGINSTTPAMIPSIEPMIKPPTIGSKGLFCKENQPSLDFTHFHKWNATEYRHGHGSLPGEEGYWLLWVAAGGCSMASLIIVMSISCLGAAI
jgi:hypothetical protein